jgi:hypothetical protein
MPRARLGEMSTAAISSAAGTVADPRQGWQLARRRLASPAVTGVALAMVAGFLAGRASRR